jgi:putative tryptophan/tyrosine transport system substrate-binding protein
MRRREFITLVARAQRAAMPVVAFVNGGSGVTSARLVAAFSKGLEENGYIDGKNVTVMRERPDALFAAPDIFFASRAPQFATFTAREKIPAAYAVSELVVAGGLMSYGTDFADLYHQVGVYSGSILNGAKTTDLPVLQLSKFEFVINLQRARALGIEVPPGVLTIADQVID